MIFSGGFPITDSSRFNAVEKAYSKSPVKPSLPAEATSGYFGCCVFNEKQMTKYLSKQTREHLAAVADKGLVLDRSIADQVASGMKQWAMDNGATHYSHWFHPLTGGTAEKHDSFSEPDGKGGCIEEFSGKLLAQQESDASSFPNGGLRATFEARGYTAWDPSSPAFIIGDTLCIPTIFISYTGEALDFKAPLLKSISVLNSAATSVMNAYFDPAVRKVTVNLGWEQEYFLVDADLYSQRPDLVLTERTLMGHESARSQQLEDHYFGSIPPRVLSFMQDLEVEGCRLGIPLKTRHNEVAPNQFEIAPVYEEMNLAVDHNMILMSVMKMVAARHGFKVLFHEKPFKGVNGSGKHCNWSVTADTGVNLFAPGKNEDENLRFMTFIVNTLMAVYKNNGLLKAFIASASNAHRLGANEAPPAIISSFLGTEITHVVKELEKSAAVIDMNKKSGIDIRIPRIPELLKDNTDRNRTSPFAFTGNRFEFRAVGSSANCAAPMTALNTAVAYQLIRFRKTVDDLIKSGVPVRNAVLETLSRYLKECRAVCFDGNGYTEEWKAEAARRGLDCETSVPLIYDNCLRPEVCEMFAFTDVMSPVELIARTEVLHEIYSKKLEIEARVLRDMAVNHILPIATCYQSEILDNIIKMKKVFSEEELPDLLDPQMKVVREISHHISAVRAQTDELTKLCEDLEKMPDGREKAVICHDRVLPYLDTIREHIDSLEMIVDDRMWPLPKYRELLFIR